MCAIFGVWNAPKAAELTVIGLHGNQHRAIDYAGIASSDGTNLYRERDAGLARQVFTGERLNRLHGRHALGHIRYPTVADDKHRDNIQPVMGCYGCQRFALAHNGNLTNADELRELLPPGQKLATSMDSELIVRLLETRHTGNFEKDLLGVLPLLKGSYALGILLPDRLIAARDPSGNRPLSIGFIGASYFISSETCAFNSLEVKYMGDVNAGEFITIKDDGVIPTLFAPPHEQYCRFEGIYYAHPSSVIFGEPVADFRIRLGKALEEHCPVVGADIVTPIPDSSTFIALGYGTSGRSGRYFPVIVRSHYVGRTFIAATQAKRDLEVSQKFAFTESEIVGRKIVVVDDSIVRGTTMPKIVAHLWRLGAREVHVRIGSPPIRYPCVYGIDTPKQSELIAAQLSVEELRVQMGVNSLAFLPLPVLQQLSPSPEKYCFACMNGTYW